MLEVNKLLVVIYLSMEAKTSLWNDCLDKHNTGSSVTHTDNIHICHHNRNKKNKKYQQENGGKSYFYVRECFSKYFDWF